MAAYARQAKDQELILMATEIKVRAERRAGEMLRESAERGERHHHGRVSPDEPKPTTLEDLGITANQSSRWQSLASMSEEHFETAVASQSGDLKTKRRAGGGNRSTVRAAYPPAYRALRTTSVGGPQDQLLDLPLGRRAK